MDPSVVDVTAAEHGGAPAPKKSKKSKASAAAVSSTNNGATLAAQKLELLQMEQQKIGISNAIAAIDQICEQNEENRHQQKPSKKKRKRDEKLETMAAVAAPAAAATATTCPMKQRNKKAVKNQEEQEEISSPEATAPQPAKKKAKRSASANSTPPPANYSPPIVPPAAAEPAAVVAANKRKASNGNVAAAPSSNNLPSSLTLLIRYMGEITFARPSILEWSPLPVTGSGSHLKAAVPTPRNSEKFAYLRLPASHDIVIEPLKTQMIDMQFGLQFQGAKNTQANQWTVENWEPLLREGVIVHSAQPQIQNLRFVLQNAGSNTVIIKAGDPLAVIRFHPLPKKLNLVYVPLLPPPQPQASLQ